MSSSKSKRTTTVLNKFGIGSSKKAQFNDPKSSDKWIHSAKEIKEGTVVYLAKYLGCIEVPKAKGVDVVKDAIKKLKVKWQVKKSEAGNKGSKLPRVEINVSIDSLKVIDCKTRLMICGRPLHRVSYCADDHTEKKIFAFIAKDQETKRHDCFVFICDKLASELTMTMGQAFQMAYQRYVDTEKADVKKNKEIISLEKEIENMKSENQHLKNQLDKQESNPSAEQSKVTAADSNSQANSGNPDTSHSFFFGSDGDTPPSTPNNFNHLANPFPPAMQSPRDDLFQANFQSDANTTAADPFDPFSDNTMSSDSKTHDDFFNGIHSTNVQKNTDDLFGDLNCDDVSVFEASAIDTSYFNGNDFNYECRGFEDLATSPDAGDFMPKVDPFADTPDWESVASEEVGGSSVSGPHNPFSAGSGQMTTNQNVDFFNSTNDKNNDPFASSFNDPFASTDFNTTNQSQDPFGDNSLSNTNTIDPFFSPGNPADPFNTNTEPSSGDNLFSTSANTTTTIITTKTVTTNDNGHLGQSHDLFSEYLNKVSTRKISEPTSDNKTDDPFGSQPFEDSMQHMGLKDQTSSSTPTARPRPSGLWGPGQSIRAPPSKQDVKNTTPPTTSTATSPSTPISPPLSRPPSLKQPPSSKGMLPNVAKVTRKAETIDGSLSRSRARSQNTILKPLKDSIQNASKSLEDLVGLDGPKPDRSSQSSNPFSPQAISPTPTSTNNDGDFFKEVHSPDKKAPFTPGGFSSYAAFKATF